MECSVNIETSSENVVVVTFLSNLAGKDLAAVEAHTARIRGRDVLVDLGGLIFLDSLDALALDALVYGCAKVTLRARAGPVLEVIQTMYGSRDNVCIDPVPAK